MVLKSDPQFPNRPDHPDFWTLSRAVCSSDEAIDSGKGFIDVLEQYANPESIFYLLDQRWLRLVNDPGMHKASKENVMKAAWIDGFVTAMKFMEERATVDGQHRG